MWGTASATVVILVVYVFCALVWSTTWFAIRRCIGPGGYPTMAAVAIRFALASALLGAAWGLGWGRPGPRTAKELRGLLLAGVLGAVAYILVYAAEERISGGLAAVIFATFPLCTAIFATFGRVEKVSRAALAGSALALVGIVVVFADRLDVSHAQAVGIPLMLGAVVASALYSIVMKNAAKAVHPLPTTGVFLATCAVVLGALAGAVERKPIPWPPPVHPTLALLYLAIVGSVLAFAGYFFLLKRVRLMTLSLLTLVEPIIALGVDAIWEKDVVLVARTYVGVGITIVGVAVSLFLARSEAPGAAEAA